MILIDKKCSLVPDYKIRCSSVIVAARSSFLKNLIIKKRQLSEPLEIVIDEHLIPRMYVPVVLHAVYTDRLDLSKVNKMTHIYCFLCMELKVICSSRTIFF